VRREYGDRPPEWLRLQRELLDPFVALAAAGAASSTRRLGTGVCLVALHDAILLAKTAATLDVLSGGRLIFGVGAGSHAEEARAHGNDPERRWAATEEKLQAILSLWHGEGTADQRPAPLQRPHPLLLVGRGGQTKSRGRPRAGCGLVPPTTLLRPDAACTTSICPITVVAPPPERVERCVLQLPQLRDGDAVRDELERLADLGEN
jgi:alkanesulfonate monooxygenase SsuD/methylene tetrahydromethanopterin reductase-like flavin-dependent oxidoreductase (luciferase family)